MSSVFQTAIPPDGLIARVSASQLETLATHPISADLYPRSMGLRTMEDLSETCRSVGVDEHILQYVVAGEGWFRTEQEEGKLSCHELLWIEPHTPHAYGPNRRMGWMNYWIHVRGAKADAFRQLLSSSGDGSVLKIGRSHSLQRDFQSMLAMLSNLDSIGSLFRCCAMLQHLLARIYQLANSEDSGSRTRVGISAAIDFMQENLHRHIKPEEIVAASGFSHARFYQMFRESSGYTPGNYLARLRIQRACQILLENEITVGQVSAQVGFNCPFHFSKTFSRLMGKSPRQFKLDGA